MAEYVHPFPILDGDREAMEFELNEGSYNATLPTGPTGGRYVEGDLVTVDPSTGMVAKVVATAGATVAAQAFFEAGADWDQPFALPYLLERGVPLNVIPQRNMYVMTYRGNAAVGAGPEPADYTLTSGDIAAFRTQPQHEVVYDPWAECLVVTNGTTNPKVTILGLYGENPKAGDINPRVIVRIHTGTGA